MSTGACQAVHWTGHCLLRPALPQQCGLLITAGLNWRISCKRRVLVRRLKKAMLGEARNSLEQATTFSRLCSSLTSQIPWQPQLFVSLGTKESSVGPSWGTIKIKLKVNRPSERVRSTPPAALVELLSIRSASKMQRCRAPSPQTLCP